MGQVGASLLLRGAGLAILAGVLLGGAPASAFDLRNPGGQPSFDPRAPGSDAFPGPGSGAPGFPGGSMPPSSSVPTRPWPPGGVVILPDGTFWPQPTIVVPRQPRPAPGPAPWPAHALPPPNWRSLLTPPPEAAGRREVRLPSGAFWTLGTPLRGDEAIFAADCWAVPPEEPGATPSGFDGGIVLPDGRRWIPGSALSPQTPVWGWMCAAWTALRLRSP